MKKVIFLFLLLALSYFFRAQILTFFSSNNNSIVSEPVDIVQGVLIADNVGVRDYPTTKGKTRVTQLDSGDMVIATKRTKGDSVISSKKRGVMRERWYFVKTVTGDSGWVFSGYIRWLPKQQLEPTSPPHQVNLPYAPQIERQEIRSYLEKDFWGNPKYSSNDLKAVVEASDYLNANVRNKSVEVASAKGSKGAYNLGQICNIYEYCHRNWRYVNDPSDFNYVAKASESMSNNRTGDCDDFAVLIATMIASIGGHPRVNYAYNYVNAHAFTEVDLGANPNMLAIKNYISARFQVADAAIHFRKDGTGHYWLNMDWMGYGVQRPGAEYYSFNNGTSYYIIEKTQMGFDPSARIMTDVDLISKDGEGW